MTSPQEIMDEIAALDAESAKVMANIRAIIMKDGWKIKTLGEVCSITRGGFPRPIQEFLTNDHDGVNWIKISDATASGKFIFETKEKIKPSGVSRSRLVKPGDFPRSRR